MASVKLGNLAPAFSLQDQNGNKISIKDFRDKKNVVIYFYPKAMTPGCKVQACGIRDSKRKLGNLDTVTLGISPDPVVRLKKFEEKESLNFTLLSDEDHSVAEKYGVWGLKKFMGKEFMGVIRSTFVVNKEGRIAFLMPKVNTKTHHEDVLNVLKSLD